MRALDPALRREIDAFSFLYRWHLPDFLVPSASGPAAGSEEELAVIASLGPELLLEELGRPLYDHGGRHGEGVYAAPAVRAAMRASSPLADLLLDDPVELTRRWTAVLAAYWEAAFAAEWERVEPVLAGAVVEAGRTLASAGIWAVLGRLPARCRVDALRRQPARSSVSPQRARRGACAASQGPDSSCRAAATSSSTPSTRGALPRSHRR